MPQLGESVTEGTVSRWLKAPGDPVARYEALVEVVTDKVNAEVPSPASGILDAILVREGETVPVGQVLARLRLPGEEPGGPVEQAPGAAPGTPATEEEPVQGVAGKVPDLPGQSRSEGGGPGSAAVPEPGSRMVASQAGATSQLPAPDADGPAGALPRGVFSPVVRRLAAEHGFDPREVPGSGRGGRVTREDVLRFLEQRSAAIQERAAADELAPPPAPEAPAAGLEEPLPAAAGFTAPAAPAAQPTAPGVTPAVPGPASPAAAGRVPDEAAPSPPAPVERLVPSPVRRTIAQRMVQSSQEIPHAWTMVEADVTGLVRLVQAQGERFRQREGVRLTYLPFVIAAVVEALKEYPLLNASWKDGEILVHRAIHIGVAVGLEDGLVVPVVRDADQKNVVGLAREIRRLVDRARSGQLTLPEVEGATFTVNNTGAFGSILSYPIINPPQAGILTLEAIVKRPVVLEDDAIAIRSMVNLCLSLDHRVIDGLYAGRFLQKVKARLEAYGPDSAL